MTDAKHSHDTKPAALGAAHRSVVKVDKKLNRKLAFCLAAAPVAWFVMELVGFIVVGRNCGPDEGLARWQWLTYGGVGAVCLLLSLSACILAWSVFRGWRSHSRLGKAEGWDRVEFLALFGFFSSALLTLNMIYFSLLPLVLEPCS